MKLEKIEKVLGLETINEMTSLDEVALRKVVVEANQAMQQVKDELEANPVYQEIKESLSFLTAAKKEVNKRQKARIEFALHLIKESGKI